MRAVQAQPTLQTPLPEFPDQDQRRRNTTSPTRPTPHRGVPENTDADADPVGRSDRSLADDNGDLLISTPLGGPDANFNFGIARSNGQITDQGLSWTTKHKSSYSVTVTATDPSGA